MSMKEKSLSITNVICIEGNGSRESHMGSGFRNGGAMYTLNTVEHHSVAYEFYVLENHPNDSRVKIKEDGIVQTLPTRMGTGGGNVPMIMKTYQEKTGCLNPGAHPGSYNGQDAYSDMLIAAVDCRNATENTVNGTLQAKSTGGTGVNFNNVCRCESVVRRLTPLECERLQGFPDNWTMIGEWTDTKGKKHKEADSPRFKALGNSIALPFWNWMAGRIVDQLKKDGVENPTMASLFDGIGGFPLVFQNHGCKPVWASEIEEFPIAVTKLHFPEEKEGEKDET